MGGEQEGVRRGPGERGVMKGWGAQARDNWGEGQEMLFQKSFLTCKVECITARRGTWEHSRKGRRAVRQRRRADESLKDWRTTLCGWEWGGDENTSCIYLF